MTLPTRSRADFWRSMAPWKAALGKPIHSAVYNAAVGMTDEEIEAVVKDALRRARRDLSS